METRTRSRRRDMLTSLVIALSCATVGGGCADTTPTSAAPPPDLPQLIATVECSAHFADGVVCTEPRPQGQDGPSFALLGGSAIKMRSANFSPDTVMGIWSMDATVQNLLTYAIGTPDGTTQTGLKVFFETGPTVTAYAAHGDTGTVTVRNPDGFQNFTAAQQPYHFYDTLLPPQGITSPKRWEFNVPRSVLRFGFTVRIFTATPRERRVPLQAPAGEPAWFRDRSYSMRCFGNSPVECLKNVVRVMFHSSTIQEERQSAVDMIRGTVVGGGGGFYYIRVPTDGTVAGLEAHISALQRLPQVRAALLYVTYGALDVGYLKPRDGTGWADWVLHADAADGDNWALERISAPLAWGCSTGDTVTPIAILDQGFHAQPDLTRNLDLANSAGWNAYAGAADTIDHGTRVAAIAAARGNDTSQVTGTMWKARLRLYDVSTDTLTGIPLGGIGYTTLWAHLRRAGITGARVINLSLGLRWRDSLDNPRNPDTETDTLQRQRDSTLLAMMHTDFDVTLDSVLATGGDPLVVVAAGNDGIDAKWSGLTSVRHAGRVLLVGASTRTNALAAFSNRGQLVEVAAPGAQLQMLWGNGSADTIRTFPSGTQQWNNGTSFAAPHVSGVAGLLFTFDPQLTAREAKSLIVQGAVRGNRSAGGIPLLNAYESLRLAAERPGAPLCGNRIWSIGGALRVQRGAGVQTLDSFPGFVRRFDPMHGGKRIRVLNDQSTGPHLTELLYENNAWRRGPTVPYDSALAPVEGSAGGFTSAHRVPGLNPPYLSMYSHSRDTVIQLREERNAAGWVSRATLTLVHPGGTQQLHPVTAPFPVGNSEAVECWIRRQDTQGCIQHFQYVTTSSSASFSAAFSPKGDSLYVAVRRNVGYGQMAAQWDLCPTPPPGDTIRDGIPDSIVRECRGHIAGQRTDDTWIFGVDLQSNTSTLLWTGPGAITIWGVVEDGSELVSFREVVGGADRTLFYLYQPPGASYYEMRSRYVTHTPASRSCEVQYRAAQSAGVTYTAHTASSCGGVRLDGTASPTIAPEAR